MSFAPSVTELLARARADLRMGVPVVLRHEDGSGALVCAVETLSPARFEAFQAGQLPDLAITRRRAETLRARAYDGDLARIVMPEKASLSWVQSVADPAGDLSHPMKGPFSCRRDGDAGLHRAALALLKSARLLPAALVALKPHVIQTAKSNDLTLISVEAVAEMAEDVSPLQEVISARVPLRVSEQSRLHVFRPDDGGEEHYAIEIGAPNRDAAVLVRLHSACFTGDLLGSLKCDCGPQLNAALQAMADHGSGVLLYLNQEGRGIGLANKMRAYSLQDQGFDTVEANHRLGFEDDERDFRVGATILRAMGIGQVRLMTNNPAKIDMLARCGIKVADRVPLHVGETAQNRAYLATKAAKSGHLL